MSDANQRVAVVLAAGKGTRMRSAKPKVLHEAAGKSLLAWVLDAARVAGCTQIAVIVGHGSEAVRAAFSAQPDLLWIEQTQQHGTGHALLQAEGHVPVDATLLVLSGDVPLLRPSTLEALARAVESGAWGAMAVAELADPGALGRVVAQQERRDALDRIVEHSDASADERAILRVNSGIYALPSKAIFGYLNALQPNNAKGEIYLTDALTQAALHGHEVRLCDLADESEAWGVNDRRDLAAAHRRLLDRHAAALMESGVTLLDPASISIEPGVTVGPDTVVHPGVTAIGRTAIGRGCALHQGAWLRDTTLADDATVWPYSVLDGATLERGSQAGPFARLRPGAHLGEGAKAGNFVEVKNSRLGRGAKASHLAYVGDAEVGDGANIGAGVITCNYDGQNKHRTEIGRGAFVGSDTMLVAPVRVGDDATTAAGSVITHDVPDGALGVGRARQRNIEDWAARRSKESGTETQDKE
ncbi:MAG: bifunctional UDP-N-acetylglucosamine diphosphorylase/glucosamine-1-phosphate N-acetyltransferase GlmU [Acidobacteriota bacterium]